jgi:hypothetical protein
LFCSVLGLGLGRPNDYVSSENVVKIRRRLLGIAFTSVWAAVPARISIAFMLLRLNISRVWISILWVAILVELSIGICANALQLTQCRPIRALWEPVPNATCMNPVDSGIASYVLVGMIPERKSSQSVKHAKHYQVLIWSAISCSPACPCSSPGS